MHSNTVARRGPSETVRGTEFFEVTNSNDTVSVGSSSPGSSPVGLLWPRQYFCLCVPPGRGARKRAVATAKPASPPPSSPKTIIFTTVSRGVRVETMPRLSLELCGSQTRRRNRAPGRASVILTPIAEETPMSWDRVHPGFPDVAQQLGAGLDHGLFHTLSPPSPDLPAPRGCRSFTPDEDGGSPIRVTDAPSPRSQGE